MNKNPIVLVENDMDDCEFLMNAFTEAGIKNEFRCFDDPVHALDYLTSTTEKTFIIISDINMPKMNGLKFKKAINENEKLNDKRIPFIFLTTSLNITDLREAYKLCVHGYFRKPDDINEYKVIANKIMDYWVHNELSEEK
jgi:DNA-binding NtrC family response regulator